MTVPEISRRKKKEKKKKKKMNIDKTIKHLLRGSLTRSLAPFPRSLRRRGKFLGREGGRGDTDLVEVGDKGGLEAVSTGSPAWREEDLFCLA